MSKYIKLDDAAQEKLIEETREKISQGKMLSGEFKLEVKVPEFERDAVILFTQEAFIKLMSLVMSFDKEVGWYCTTDRVGELDDDVYIIKDVLVFPQEVTGTTVDSDDEARVLWFDSLPVDVLKEIRCDCHSHVNMGVSPSQTDINDMQSVLKNLTDDAFRIFMIWNKKLECTAKIYDMAKNVFFDTGDIDIDIIGMNVNDFLLDAKDLVKTKISTTKYTPSKAKTPSKKEKKEVMVSYEDDAFDEDDFFDEDLASYYHRKYGAYNYGAYGYDW